jgi:hypothetical protein
MRCTTYDPVVSSDAETSELYERFHAIARRLRVRIAVRRGLTYAAYGLVIGVVSALALVAVHRLALLHPLWQRGGHWMRPALGALGIAGLVAGVFSAWRRRPDDATLALYLDARLGTKEAILTSLDEIASPSVRSLVVSRGLKALRRARVSELGVPIFRRLHVVVPVMLAALACASWIPIAPKPPPPPAPPGSVDVRVTEVKGLESATALADLPPRDEAQRERLKKIAEEAARIREEAKNGASERDVKADVSKLADDIERERMSLGSGNERRGFEAAVDSMQKNPDLDRATKALLDHDVASFDREMQRATANPEAAARAIESLKQAESAARNAGAEQVAQALAEERKALAEQRDAGADASAPKSQTAEAARSDAMQAAEEALGAAPQTAPGGKAGNDESDSQRTKRDMSASHHTPKIAAAEQRLPVKGDPKHGAATTTSMSAGREASHAETANTRGTGALGAVSAEEIGGVSQSDVPEAYREQVGSYFRP